MKGRIKTIRFKSEVLKNNPLKDSYVRDLLVYLPKNYSMSYSKGYITVFLLPSFGNNNYSILNSNPFSFTILQILENLIDDDKCGEMIIVIINCFNKLGGSQYINSNAIGNYRDYLVDEIVPYINSKFNVTKNALLGKSSGGYGAITIGMQNPKLFNAVAAHSFDSAFEYCYLPDFPVAFKMLKEEGGPNKWLTRFWRKENKVEKKELTTLNILSMAAHYSPKEKINDNKLAVSLPFNLRTGEIDKKIWKKWKLHDPIGMIDKFKDNLKHLDLLFFDCGIYDEFNLFIGTKIFSEKCKRLGINHEYNQFNGGHFNTSFRYVESLSRVYSSLSK
ncbi:MAG: alpha/beta hydrolase [Candidatus Nitrosocosmicus sp.]